MNAQRELLDAVIQAKSTMDNVAYEVGDVSDLLHAVGLSKLAVRLSQCILPLRECGKALRDSYGEAQSEDLRHSEEMTGNLLLLALSGATKAGAA